MSSHWFSYRWARRWKKCTYNWPYVESRPAYPTGTVSSSWGTTGSMIFCTTKWKSHNTVRTVYLQLAILREQIWLSSGYSFKFMGQDRVNDTLHINHTIIFLVNFTSGGRKRWDVRCVITSLFGRLNSNQFPPHFGFLDKSVLFHSIYSGREVSESTGKFSLLALQQRWLTKRVVFVSFFLDTESQI